MNTKDSPLYKNSGNRLNSVDKLQHSRAEQSIYERISVDHPRNCRELIGCNCTPIEISEQLAEEWRRKIAELHKGRNERRRLVKISRIQQQQQEGDNWNPLGIPEEEL